MNPTERPGGAEPPGAVGGYELLATLGEGGMGVVHLARRDGQRVALKVLRQHIVGDPEARARLAREVESLQRIHSRWVAEIIDADPWGPVPFIATRYVPGLSLHDHVVEEGPIRGAELVRFAGALAEGLASVHAVGVLHRDVKPGNVLMEGRAPILIDFGLARVADDPRLTHAGWLIGTPGYLAPEILYGDDATTASDVHSWAATVAYAGGGAPPFGRGPSAAIMDRVRRGEHDLRGITDPMRALLADALSVEPHQRPTIPEILEELAAMGDLGFDELTATYATDAPRTRVLTETATVADRGPASWEDELVEDEAARPKAAERVRRALLVLSSGLVIGAGFGAYPWLCVALLSVLVWLVRSGSLAASATGARRDRRGRRWYDGAQALLLTPWDLVRSIPATLLLLIWGLGLGSSGGLLGYAISGDERVGLVVTGAVAAIGVWSGPGASRVRRPVMRLVEPLAAQPRRWGIAMAFVVVVGLVLGILVEHQGTQWDPWQKRPLSGQVVPRGAAGHGTMGT